MVSVLGNAALIRKICFPCEVFPLTSVVTKLVELTINALILAGLMMCWHDAEHSGGLVAADHCIYHDRVTLDRGCRGGRSTFMTATWV